MRVIYRICHFILYACLFLVKFASLKFQYYLNNARWMFLLAIYKLNEDALMLTCTTRNRLGEKRLSHTAIVLNNLHLVENNPPVA